MPQNQRTKQRKKGFALIYVTLIGTFVLIPMGGLAIDFGMLYNIKARLQTACDAAAIGAGYLLHASTNLSNPAQLATVTTAAQSFFNANYPTHYFGSTLSAYSATVTSSTSGKTITVNATAHVPMLLMRVLGIANSTVAAVAVSNVKFISMMIVVDRSGSVVVESADATIQSALTTFVADSTTSYLVDGVDTVGMISFGGTWKLDYTPNIHFQTASPNIGTAINNIPFRQSGGGSADSSTNTGEGLYQGWTQLYQMGTPGSGLPGSLNVIVLLTDGRPTALTSNFTPSSGSSCSSKIARPAVMDTFVNLGSSYPWWPPPTSGTDTEGLYGSTYQGVPENTYPAANSTNCAYASSLTNLYQDLNNTFPGSVGPVDRVGSTCGGPCNPSYANAAGAGIPTQSGYYNAPGQTLQNPQAGRYAAFNYADNMAKLIRKDTTLAPMLFVIGLNYTTQLTEPLDADWLARVANDPNYVTVGSDPNIVAAGQSVYQTGQTPGMYCNSTPATLGACFQQVTSALLRLIQ